MEKNIRPYLATLLDVDESGLEPNDETLEDVLRKRLTKKERKLLYAEATGSLDEATKNRIAPDEERLESIRTALHKKLHHPKIRNDLVQQGA